MKGNHVFAVCAYQKSPYLEECVRSLKCQTVPSEVIICTSTPSEWLSRLASELHVPLYVREGESSLREDWLFAWRTAGKTHRLVTIAHQDDRYHRDYTKHLLACAARYPDMTVFMSDYVVLRTKEGKTQDGTCYPVHTDLAAADGVRFVKKLMRLSLRVRPLSDRTWLKRSVLRFGNPICCPTCTYRYERIGDAMFRSDSPFALDWENLYELAAMPGRFVCVEKPLLAYRIHDGATTKQCIEDHRRSEDELRMFQKLWPGWAARILMHFYRKAYDSYGKSRRGGRERTKRDDG